MDVVPATMGGGQAAREGEVAGEGSLALDIEVPNSEFTANGQMRLRQAARICTLVRLTVNSFAYLSGRGGSPSNLDG